MPQPDADGNCCGCRESCDDTCGGDCSIEISCEQSSFSLSKCGYYGQEIPGDVGDCDLEAPSTPSGDTTWWHKAIYAYCSWCALPMPCGVQSEGRPEGHSCSPIGENCEELYVSANPSPEPDKPTTYFFDPLNCEGGEQVDPESPEIISTGFLFEDNPCCSGECQEDGRCGPGDDSCPDPESCPDFTTGDCSCFARYVDHYSDEYTDDQLIDNVVGNMPNYAEGGCTASRALSTDEETHEVSFSLTKLRYTITTTGGVSHWDVVFYPLAGGDPVRTPMSGDGTYEIIPDQDGTYVIENLRCVPS